MTEQEYIKRYYAGELTDGWRFFGAHPETREGQKGWMFRLWAPKAQKVSVVGNFNNWNEDANNLTYSEGIWSGFIPGLADGDNYKYAVVGADGRTRLKADPYGFRSELRPDTASRLCDISGFRWTDKAFRTRRGKKPVYSAPLNIYEVHLGSWKKKPDGTFYTYRELAVELADYVQDMGYNAIELLPVTEYPLDMSWGYQCIGYFAATARYGTPEDLMWFVNHMHEKGISVILDWVPAHFCKDVHGLIDFDGTYAYEHFDDNKRENEGWGTRVFDFGKREVISFLLSSARFWLEEYHMDGIRVDAVASMLYLDYGREGKAWTPNRFGGRENLEAIEFLKKLNTLAFAVNPNVLMVAEESTAFAGVTKPVELGGLGFNLKWNMGWMNDVCHYLKMDPFFRRDHHHDVTFSMAYAFSENFVLPVSHDEVVHMKGSLRGKMPGDDWQQLAGVRSFYAYMLCHPGKKMTFMGAELGQWHEWNFRDQLDWYLLDEENCRKTHECIRALNRFYRKHKALWENDRDWDGFHWQVVDDNTNNVLVFRRTDRKGKSLLFAVNFSPVAHEHYRFGVPPKRQYEELFNTDDVCWGGSGVVNAEPIFTEHIPAHGEEQSIELRIPPLGAVILQGKYRLSKRSTGGKEA